MAKKKKEKPAYRVYERDGVWVGASIRYQKLFVEVDPKDHEGDNDSAKKTAHIDIITLIEDHEKDMERYG